MRSASTSLRTWGPSCWPPSAIAWRPLRPSPSSAPPIARAARTSAASTSTAPPRRRRASTSTPASTPCSASGAEHQVAVEVEEIQMRCFRSSSSTRRSTASVRASIRSARDGDHRRHLRPRLPPLRSRGGPFRYVDAIGAPHALRRIEALRAAIRQAAGHQRRCWWRWRERASAFSRRDRAFIGGIRQSSALRGGAPSSTPG